MSSKKSVKERLEKYKKKRNFDVTNEPLTSETEDKTTPKNEKEELEDAPLKEHNSFVVQYHEATRDHYDFRLEWQGVLLSWAVPKGISYNSSDRRLAVQVEDHPLAYADFEGTIPKGEYGGGTVMVWDKGVYESVGEMERGLNKGVLSLILFGEKLKGGWNLIRIEDNGWLIIKAKDEFAKKSEGVSKLNKSVKSGRTISEIAKDKPFKEKTKKAKAEKKAKKK